MAVSIAKKHLTSLTQNFNPHTPYDENGLVRLLSWQSGHTPTTHSHHYALEREFPAKLQPQLIDRYLDNSRIWHEFTQTQDNNMAKASLQFNTSLQLQRNAPLNSSYSLTEQHVEKPKASEIAEKETNIWDNDQGDNKEGVEDEDSGVGGNDSEEWRDAPSQSHAYRRSRKRKRRETVILSPTSEKIARIQQELSDLIQERNQKRIKKKGKDHDGI
jgi:hypothetical protein